MSKEPKTAIQLALEAARGGVIGQALETIRSPAVAAALETMRSPAMTEALRAARTMTDEARRQDAALRQSPIKDAIDALRVSEKLTDPLGSLRDASAELEGPISFQQLKKRAHIAEAARTEMRPSARRERFVQGSLASGATVAPAKNADLDLVEGAEDIGALVQRARKAKSLSQQDLAERAGVGRRFVSELENGKPTLEFARVILVARAAGVDLFARTSA